MDKITTRPKPYPLRLEPELAQWVKDKAKADARSLNSQINRFLRKIKEIEEHTFEASPHTHGK